MTHEEFWKLLDEFVEEERKIFRWKSGEYTDGQDKLLNFKEVALFLGQTPAQVCLEYLIKHVHSVKLAVMNGGAAERWDWETAGGEGLKQRIADIRNYALLLGACIEEEVRERRKCNEKTNGIPVGANVR